MIFQVAGSFSVNGVLVDMPGLPDIIEICG